MSASPFDDTRKRLWDELVSVHDAWAQYVYLFGSSEDRVRILNACARWFFGLTQRVLMREVILGVSRLTDPLKTGNFDNLVISRLLEDPLVAEHPGLREELSAAIEKAISAAGPLRAHRNKYIAHLDHATAIGSPDAPLPSLKRETITNAIQSLEAAYNVHGYRIRESHTFFDLSPTGGADALLASLESSERWKDWQSLQERRAKHRENAT